MNVTVQYVGYLNLAGVKNGASVEINVSTSVKILLDRFKIREEHRQYIIPVVNGKKEKLSYVLQDGDSLFLHLPVGGG